MDKHSISRRDFLKGAALGAVGIAGLGLTGIPTKAEAAVEEQSAFPAGADWLGEAPEIAESEITETIETEVLICGGGTGGLFAGAATAELGLQTLIIEKNAMLGTVRDDIGSIGSRLQIEDGSIVDKAEAIKTHMMYCAGRVDERLAHIWANESGAAVDWYEQILEESGGAKLWVEGGYDQLPEGFYKKFPTGHSPAYEEGMTGTIIVSEYVKAKGGEIRLETPLVKIECEGKKVTGVIARDTLNKTYIRINASKGVIIATGGYQQNTAMLHALQPDTVNLMPPLTDGAVSGEGIKACLWMGAEMDDVHTSMLFDRRAIPPNETPATATQVGFFWTGSQPFLKLNLRGERFANESIPYDFMPHTASMQKDKCYVMVYDANYGADIERFNTVGCSRQYPYPNGAAPNIPFPAVDGMNQGLIEQGLIQVADTLEELAEKVNVPVETFVASVNRYNELFDAQEDADFYKEPYRLSEIRTAPFYAVRTCSYILCTLDGIRIDTQMRPLDTDSEPFEGIHVIGDASGSYYAHTYPNFFTGHAAGRTLTFARRVARVLNGETV